MGWYKETQFNLCNSHLESEYNQHCNFTGQVHQNVSIFEYLSQWLFVDDFNNLSRCALLLKIKIISPNSTVLAKDSVIVNTILNVDVSFSDIFNRKIRRTVVTFEMQIM